MEEENGSDKGQPFRFQVKVIPLPESANDLRPDQIAVSIQGSRTISELCRYIEERMALDGVRCSVESLTDADGYRFDRRVAVQDQLDRGQVLLASVTTPQPQQQQPQQQQQQQQSQPKQPKQPKQQLQQSQLHKQPHERRREHVEEEVKDISTGAHNSISDHDGAGKSKSESNANDDASSERNGDSDSVSEGKSDESSDSKDDSDSDSSSDPDDSDDDESSDDGAEKVLPDKGNNSPPMVVPAFVAAAPRASPVAGPIVLSIPEMAARHGLPNLKPLSKLAEEMAAERKAARTKATVTTAASMGPTGGDQGDESSDTEDSSSSDSDDDLTDDSDVGKKKTSIPGVRVAGMKRRGGSTASGTGKQPKRKKGNLENLFA